MRCTLVFIFLLFSGIAYAQTSFPSIGGEVIDRDNRQPLAGATVSVTADDYFNGTVTDERGRFEIKNIPPGRYRIEVSYLGYETERLSNVLHTSARALSLDVSLRRTSVLADEVVIRPLSTDSDPGNEFSLLSSRSFTVEETQRYAASVNDPGRLAVGFPGVQPQRDTRTDIFVRGNSASGVSWRLMGIDIPNPNHFARIGSSGGGISIFSASLLATSDFSSGAFPAEYGNALAGVFDMQFRRGDMYNRQYTFRAGILGLDFAAEGPIKKGESSYLVNYRYSTLGILNELGIHLVGPRISNTFQDLSFMTHFSLPESRHQFSIWGIGGISRENERAEEDINDWKTYTDYQTYDFNTNMGAIGLRHTFSIDDQSFLTNSIALMGQQIEFRYDTLNTEMDDFTVDDQLHRDNRLTLASTYHRSINPKIRLKAGIHASLIFYDFFREEYEFESRSQQTIIDGSGTTGLLEAYGQLSWIPTTRWQLTAGLRSMHFTLNNTTSLEPRMAIRYQISSQQRIGLAYGLHAMALPLGSYFTRSPELPGQLPNLNLDLLRSHHLVFSYSIDFAEGWRLGAEAYLQFLRKAPVVDDPDRTYWYLNEIQSFATEPLVSEGKGINRGVDITLERFFSRGIFMILSGSIFKSESEALDGKRHSTQFNSRYAGTGMGGYELDLGEGNSLQFGAKVIYTAGLPITPLLENVEFNDRNPPLDESRPFSIQVEDYFRTDLRVAWRKNYPTSSFLLALDIQNVTSRENVDIVRRQYDPDLNEWVYNRLAGITPLISFQLEF